jgi:hypothetical protein
MVRQMHLASKVILHIPILWQRVSFEVLTAIIMKVTTLCPEDEGGSSKALTLIHQITRRHIYGDPSLRHDNSFRIQ